MKLLRPPLLMLAGGLVVVFILLSLNRTVIKPLHKDPYLAKLELGLMYMQSSMQQGKNPMAGIQLIRKLTIDYPNRFEAFAQLGKSAMTTGQYEKAASWFKKASSACDGQYKVFCLVNCSDALVMVEETTGAEKTDSVRMLLTEAMHITNDPTVKSGIDQRLKELK